MNDANLAGFVADARAVVQSESQAPRPLPSGG